MSMKRSTGCVTVCVPASTFSGVANSSSKPLSGGIRQRTAPPLLLLRAPALLPLYPAVLPAPETPVTGLLLVLP